MKIEIRSLTILVCAALALISCTQKPHDPEPENIPIGFRPMSQAVWVKSDPKPLSDFYPDFGVWGIARHSEISSPYILWTSDDLTQVTKNNAANAPANQYIPTEDAYWLSGYEYTFLAVAPYGDTGMSDVSFTLKDATGNTTGKDLMTFTYDLSSKYTQNTPQSLAFDFLGAAAESGVIAGGHSSPQPLTFWHLLSKLCIKVNFIGVAGAVTEIRLSDVVTKGSYRISLDNVEDFDKPLNIIYTPSENETDKMSLVLDSTNKVPNATSQWILHIIPQVVTGFDMYMDFKIGDVEVNNFKVNLSAAGDVSYTHNGAYNWNINITPKGITFNPTVTPWVEDTDGDHDFDFE